MARIGVVTAAYNALPYLDETVRSVVAQTFTDWELVIVDDASTDETLATARGWAERDERIRVVAMEQNSGPSVVQNRGFAELDPETPYVSFLNGDDYWEPAALAELLAVLESDPSALGAHCKAHFVDERSNSIPKANLDLTDRRKVLADGGFGWASAEEPTTFAMLVVQSCIMTPGQMLLRREAFADSEGFRPQTSPGEDWDLWIQIARGGHFAVVDSELLNYRQHGAQLRRTPAIVTAGATVRRLAVEAPENTPEQRALAIAGQRYFQRVVSGRRVGWALDNLRAGRPLNAAREVVRAGADYLGSLRPRPGERASS